MAYPKEAEAEVALQWAHGRSEALQNLVVADAVLVSWFRVLRRPRSYPLGVVEAQAFVGKPLRAWPG